MKMDLRSQSEPGEQAADALEWSEYNSRLAEANDVRADKWSQSGKALLIAQGGASCWVPRSVIDTESEVFAPGDEGTLLVQRWFAEKNW